MGARGRDSPGRPDNVKHDRIGRSSVNDAEQFKAKTLAALRRLQKMSHLVRAFFADPDLRYITA